MVGDVVVRSTTPASRRARPWWSQLRSDRPHQAVNINYLRDGSERVTVATLSTAPAAPSAPTPRRGDTRVPNRRAANRCAATAPVRAPGRDRYGMARSAAAADQEPGHTADRADDRQTHADERQLLAPPRAHRRQRSARIGLDVDLVAVQSGLPSGRPQAVVGHDPGVLGVGPARMPVRPGRRGRRRPAGGAASRPAGGRGRPDRPARPARRTTASRRGRRCRRRRGRSRRAWSSASARSSRCRNCDGRPAPLIRTARADHGDRTSHDDGLGVDRHGGPQHRDLRVGVVATPLDREPFDLGAGGGVVVARLGAQRRLFGQRHRVVRPGAVDDRARQDHDPPRRRWPPPRRASCARRRRRPPAARRVRARRTHPGAPPRRPGPGPSSPRRRRSGPAASSATTRPTPGSVEARWTTAPAQAG